MYTISRTNTICLSSNFPEVEIYILQSKLGLLFLSETAMNDSLPLQNDNTGLLSLLPKRHGHGVGAYTKEGT